MDIEESSLLEELVSGESQVVSHSGHCSDQVGPGSQVGDLSQELHKVSHFNYLLSVLLLGQWILSRVTLANNPAGVIFRLEQSQFKLLPLSLTLNDLSHNGETCAHIGLNDFLKAFNGLVHYNLIALTNPKTVLANPFGEIHQKA